MNLEPREEIVMNVYALLTLDVILIQADERIRNPL